MHAEAHALGSMWPVLDRLDASAVIVTLTKADNFAVSSRPCAFCANLLQKHNIKRVHYAELCNDDTWAVATHDVSALHSAAGEITMYAKNMRIV